MFYGYAMTHPGLLLDDAKPSPPPLTEGLPLPVTEAAGVSAAVATTVADLHESGIQLGGFDISSVVVDVQSRPLLRVDQLTHSDEDAAAWPMSVPSAAFLRPCFPVLPARTCVDAGWLDPGACPWFGRRPCRVAADVHRPAGDGRDRCRTTGPSGGRGHCHRSSRRPPAGVAGVSTPPCASCSASRRAPVGCVGRWCSS